jgi:hypothetical protein
METLEGFPNLPALWLQWAKPTSANAPVVEEVEPIVGRHPAIVLQPCGIALNEAR